MRFDYTYRTHGNELKTGSLSASSREDVYRRLKAEGINPSKVVRAPGALNYLASFGKRGWGLIVLAIVCIALAAVLVRSPKTGGRISDAGATTRELKARGLDQSEVDAYMKERAAFHEAYRKQIAERVKKGALTLEAANEMLKAVGIAPL